MEEFMTGHGLVLLKLSSLRLALWTLNRKLR